MTYLTWDAANRNTVVQDPMAGKTYFHYDANANRTALLDAEGHPTYFEWDAMDRMSKTKDAVGKEQGDGVNSRRLTDVLRHAIASGRLGVLSSVES